LGCYRAVVTEHPRAGAGLAIFRTQQHGRFSVAHVCELLSEREDGRIARRLVQGVRARAGADLLVCALPSARVAVRCGLMRSRRTAMIAANPLREGLEPDPVQPSSWELSLGDLELI
jgi:hypothetical protein